MKIATIDYDGTCVKHDFTKQSEDIGAAPVLLEMVKNGWNLILFTMRGTKSFSLGKWQNDGVEDAVEWFKRNNIPLYGIQTNPTQHEWTDSPKAYSHLIIDDTALGIPLIRPEAERPYVDWVRVREMLLEEKFI